MSLRAGGSAYKAEPKCPRCGDRVLAKGLCRFHYQLEYKLKLKTKKGVSRGTP